MVEPCDLSLIEGALQRRRSLRLLLAIAAIALGAPLSLLGPLVLGTLFWTASCLWFETLYSWCWFFFPLVAVALPLLFRLELKTGGDYLGGTVKDAGPPIPGTTELTMQTHLVIGPFAGLGVAAATNPRLVPAGFVEIFLVGPRLILSGVHRLRHDKRLGNIAQRLAAEIVAKLLSKNEGLRLEQLPKNGADSDQLMSALRWLAFYGWIGITEAQDRVYLYSESKAVFG